MNKRNLVFWACVTYLAFAAQTLPAEELKQPNLLIIQTDEHNFRTLGCYRQQMSFEQAHVWGRGVRVDTPHIDSIARQGAICTSFYAASPVCTPSRASLVSGLYPQATGSPSNDMPLNDDIVTFAEILRRKGYATAYVGKWHLDGKAKPGWAPKRKFGFEDNRFMFNRGHWKLFQQTENGARLIGKFDAETEKYKYNIEDATDKSFATDRKQCRLRDQPGSDDEIFWDGQVHRRQRGPNFGVPRIVRVSSTHDCGFHVRSRRHDV